MRPHLHYVSLTRRVRRRKDSTGPRAISRGKTFTIRSHLTCTRRWNSADSNHHSAFCGTELNAASHLATYVLLPVVRLCFSPWSFSTPPCSNTPFHSGCASGRMCVSGYINYWLWVYSRLPGGPQLGDVAKPLSSFFFSSPFLFPQTFTELSGWMNVSA